VNDAGAETASADERARIRRVERHTAASLRALADESRAEYKSNRVLVGATAMRFASPYLIADVADTTLAHWLCDFALVTPACIANCNLSRHLGALFSIFWNNSDVSPLRLPHSRVCALIWTMLSTDGAANRAATVLLNPNWASCSTPSFIWSEPD